MNFSVTGEPVQGGVDAKRKQLIQGLLGSTPGAQRLLGQHTGGGGFSRGYTASDGPTAALPGLTFNPFLAQQQRGQQVDAPTANVRQSIDDMTGAARGQGAPSLQGAPVQDGSGAIGAPPANANPQGLAQLMAGQPQVNPEAGIRWLYGNQPLPSGPPAPDYYGGAQPNIPFARGRNIAN